jgi:hypothetical protein
MKNDMNLNPEAMDVLENILTAIDSVDARLTMKIIHRPKAMKL